MIGKNLQEIAKLSKTHTLLPIVINYFYEMKPSYTDIYIRYDGSFGGRCMQFLPWLSPNCVKWRREICKIPIGKSTLLWLKTWRDSGSNDKSKGEKGKLANLRILTFSLPAKHVFVFALMPPMVREYMGILSWNWYYLIFCRMVDSTYKCGPLYMYRYVICK